MATVKLSTTLIIVIAVSSLVGCIVILLLIFRCCCRPKSAPLPPVQPLAHHREKNSTYLHPRTLHSSRGPSQLGGYESDASLLKPSRKPSFQTDESNGTPSSSNYSLSAPSFPQTDLISRSSPLLAEDQQTSTQQYVPTTRQARSASRVGSKRPRSRITSTTSTNTAFTQVSPRPISTIRGAPHSALSDVQIVLPVPLAPQLQNRTVTAPLMAGINSISDQDLSTRDASRGSSTGSSPRIQSHRSLDAMDQPMPSESQAQFRGRNTSHRSIQPQLLSHDNTPLSPPSPDEQTQPSNAASKDPHYGQAG